MQADELSHLFCWNAYNAAPEARVAKRLQDIVYFYMVLLTIKMKLKEASTFYLQLSRQLTVHLLFKNIDCITIWFYILLIKSNNFKLPLLPLKTSISDGFKPDSQSNPMIQSMISLIINCLEHLKFFSYAVNVSYHVKKKKKRFVHFTNKSPIKIY